jgi:Uma2 family endonuclease
MSTKTLITAEDLLEMPDAKYCELVEGELVEKMPAQDQRGAVAVELIGLLYNYLGRNPVGILTTAEVGYVVRRDPDTVRSPDVGFVSRERIPAAGRPQGFWPFAPDLAIEIVSPSNRYGAILRKVGEYLDAGARMVWVAVPRTRSVTIYTPDLEPVVLHEDDTLDGGAVLPGFSVRVGDLFESGS